jgi:hypothetical protein
VNPDAIARLLRGLEASVPKCTHLRSDPATYSYMRSLIMPGAYYAVMFNPFDPAQREILNRIPACDYLFAQPVTLVHADPRRPLTADWCWSRCCRNPKLPASTRAPPSPPLR